MAYDLAKMMKKNLEKNKKYNRVRRISNLHKICSDGPEDSRDAAISKLLTFNPRSFAKKVVDNMDSSKVYNYEEGYDDKEYYEEEEFDKEGYIASERRKKLNSIFPPDTNWCDNCNDFELISEHIEKVEIRHPETRASLDHFTVHYEWGYCHDEDYDGERWCVNCVENC